MQSEYAHEFTVFEPDKKLKWLPHLGTVQLEIELEDRTLEVDAPPLEAVFIKLFSEKRNFYFYFLGVLDTAGRSSSAIWVLAGLIEVVEAVDRSASLKVLSTCVDHGILIEDPAFTFNLLERADLGSSGARERDPSRLGVFSFSGYLRWTMRSRYYQQL